MSDAPRLNMNDARSAIDTFDRATEAQLGLSVRRGCAVHLPARGRLLATGDLHDNPVHFEKVVRLAKLEASNENHVVLHELIHGEHLINGMDFSYRMLLRVADLVIRFPGQAHPLLANHEISQMTGAGVSKGAGNSVELFNEALDFVFGDDAEEVAEACGRFIAAMPLVLLTEDGVACAHSLPNARLAARVPPEVIDRALVDEDFRSPLGVAYLMTWGRTYDDAQVESLAAAWGVRLFCLGHQSVETGIEQRGSRVVVLNSDHERAMVLPLDLSKIPDPGQAIMDAIPLAAV